MSGGAWRETAGRGWECYGMSGGAGKGKARRGEARLGGDRRGKDWTGGLGMVDLTKNQRRMKGMTSKKDSSVVVDIARVEKATVKMYVVGTSPIILNRLSEKVKRELLLPRGKKTKADKESIAKHSPIEEYQSSPYLIADEAAETYLGFMASAFKGAMRVAALDLPGSNKAQIGRLVYVEGDLVPLYGVPKLLMSITRSADINKTPDVRTRAIVPKWAAELNISFVTPIMKLPAILNLLAAAGITSGVGDWRPEKGKGDYGQFRIANEDDPELIEIMKAGRPAQIAAMETPETYDRETEELLSWYAHEAPRRGFKVDVPGRVLKLV